MRAANLHFILAAFSLSALTGAATSCISPGGGTLSINAPTNGSSSSSNATCTGAPHDVVVTWNANREKAVNSSGGGYLVYYSQTSPVNTSTASYVNVPYVSGASTPNSTTLPSMSCGTWHFVVVAYSSIPPSGSTSGAKSIASTEVAVVVP